MILESREERIKLLKAGFNGMQVERLFSLLNGFEIVGVDWDGTAMKCEVFSSSTSMIHTPPHMKAAPSPGARA